MVEFNEEIKARLSSKHIEWIDDDMADFETLWNSRNHYIRCAIEYFHREKARFLGKKHEV